MSELTEDGYGVMIAVSNEEGKDTQLLDPLGPQCIELYGLPTEQNYMISGVRDSYY
jgi:hypothetical protein